MAPMMDLSAALTNPYTLDTFSVLRRAETVNNYGESSAPAGSLVATQGVVYAEGARTNRKPDAGETPKNIVVITRYSLRGMSAEAGSNFQPDLVLWHGNQYIVMDVNDFSSYGSGFIQARCEMRDMLSTAPENQQ